MKTTKWQPPPIYGMEANKSGILEKIKPYVVIALLTTFWLYSIVASVHWGQHHCIKHHKRIKK